MLFLYFRFEAISYHYPLEDRHNYLNRNHSLWRNPTTYKYNNAHTFMEVFLDNDMIRRREKVNPYTFDFISYCFDTRPFSESLKGAIRYSFYNTFKIRDMDIIYFFVLKLLVIIIL